MDTVNHFAEYIPRRYCPALDTLVDESHSCEKDYLSISHLFLPSAKLHDLSEGECVSVTIGVITTILYDATDILWWAKKKQEQDIPEDELVRGIKGVMGERMLSLLMEYFLQVVSHYEEEKKGESSFKENNIISGVLREPRKHRGKGYIARFNNDYLLRFKGVSNFVILKKDTHTDVVTSYQQERFGLISTEIDGLGYLHVGDERYLLIGESFTKREFNLHSWNKNRHTNGIEERVFDPFKSLFPNHHLIYFVMGYEESLFDLNFNPLRIKGDPNKVYTKLKEIGVDTCFVPIPKTDKSLLLLAETIVKQKIGLVKSLLTHIQQ